MFAGSKAAFARLGASDLEKQFRNAANSSRGKKFQIK